MTTKTNQRLNSAQIDELNRRLGERMTDVLDYFGLSYEERNDHVCLCCPIHEGDNEFACCVYTDGDERGAGNWMCYTQQCHRKYINSPLGFVRGYLHTTEGQDSFPKAIDFAVSFLGDEGRDLGVTEEDAEHSRFSSALRTISKKRKTVEGQMTRDEVVKRLKRPVGLFISRGFKAETLERFDVGVCVEENREMTGRAVVPIYDDEHTYMVGCLGRTLGNDPRKWLNSSGIRTQAYLYNYWYAKAYIEKYQSVIVVEGCPNVWRLYEAGIYNAVAMFGSALSDEQEIILQCSGALNIGFIRDNDTAGEKAARQVEKKCERMFNVHQLQPIEAREDVGDMTVEEIDEHLKPELERHRLWHNDS